MALSRSSSGPFRQWAMRTIAAFLVVYILGAFGIPTLIPYIAVVLAVALDAVRIARAYRRADFDSARRHDRVHSRHETIH